MSRKVIYAARLNILDFIRLGLSKGFGAEVFYDEHKTSRLMRFVANRTQRFKPARLDFNKKNEKGVGLLYDFQATINGLIGDILKTAQSVPSWLKTSLFWDVRLTLEYSIVFIESAKRRAIELGQEQVEYYVLSTPFFEQTQRFFALKGISLKALPGIPSTWKILSSVMFRFFMKTSATHYQAERPAIWMEYAVTSAFKLTFWRKFVKNQAFDIVYYLDRADTPPHRRITETIEKERVAWIDLHASQLLGLSGLGGRDVIKIWRRSLSFQGLRWPLKIMAFKHQVWHAAYVRVFGKNRVKMLIQHQDRSWAQVVQAQAMEEVGGIMLGYHWSNLPYCMPNWFCTAQHVYFVWGQASYEAIIRKGNSCRHILPSGMWIEESVIPEDIKDYAAYSGFKLAVFDSDASYGIWQSLTTLSDFFNSVIGLLEKHQDWKALFKFKFAEPSLLNALPNGERIASRVAALIKDRRLYMAHPSLSPITAGKLSDLSICYTLNSAGICAQTRGAKAVHWDAVGLHYPLIGDPSQKILFATLEETIHAVEQAAAGDSQIGDFSRWRSLFDYFGDAKAGERIGWFIEAYMSEVISNSGASGLTIADRIRDQYIERYQINPDFYGAFTFWV